jgi:hypothetical protein
MNTTTFFFVFLALAIVVYAVVNCAMLDKRSDEENKHIQDEATESFFGYGFWP